MSTPPPPALAPLYITGDDVPLPHSHSVASIGQIRRQRILNINEWFHPPSPPAISQQARFGRRLGAWRRGQHGFSTIKDNPPAGRPACSARHCGGARVYSYHCGYVRIEYIDPSSAYLFGITRRPPPRNCGDARVYGPTDYGHAWYEDPPPPPPPISQSARLWRRWSA